MKELFYLMKLKDDCKYINFLRIVDSVYLTKEEVKEKYFLTDYNYDYSLIGDGYIDLPQEYGYILIYPKSDRFHHAWIEENEEHMRKLIREYNISRI